MQTLKALIAIIWAGVVTGLVIGLVLSSPAESAEIETPSTTYQQEPLEFWLQKAEDKNATICFYGEKLPNKYSRGVIMFCFPNGSWSQIIEQSTGKWRVATFGGQYMIDDSLPISHEGEKGA